MKPLDSPIVQEYVARGRSADCPVINTHAHFGPYQGIYFPHDDPEQVVRMMDKAGVRWLIASHHQALVDTRLGNGRYAEIMARYPDRFRGYWAINPRYPQRVVEEIAGLDQQPHFVGLKFLSDYYQYPITGDNYRPALEYANARGCPVLLHTWGGSPYDGPGLWAEVAERYPRIHFLMGHSGHGEWQVASELARDHDNIILELTAAYACRGAIELMVEIAGSRKITFGDDHPWFDPLYGVGAVLFADITDDDRRNVLYRNAQRIFGLPE